MTEALKAAIARDGRTLAGIARAGGITKGVLSRFARNERTLTLKTADQICAGLGVDVRLIRVRKPKGGER